MTLRYMESEFGLVRSAASLKNMLTNTKYIGEFRDNKNYCPAIIDRDLFFDVQRLLKINIKSGKKHDYIFSGLVVCDDCDVQEVVSVPMEHELYINTVCTAADRV